MNKTFKLLIPGALYAAAFFVFMNGPAPSLADPVTPPQSHNNPVMAVVDGRPITLDDLKDIRMQDMLVQLYGMQKNVLKQKIVRLLREKHPELWGDGPPKVTRENVFSFYKRTPGVSELGGFDDMQDEIREYLKKSFEKNFVDKIYQQALKKGWVVDYLKAPNDFQVVAGIGSAVLFNEDKDGKRKVFVMEYSDFQCPFCKKVQAVLSKIRVRYGQVVQFGYRHFPLSFHQNAQGLAEASECARDQGRFWELQASIYRNDTDNLKREDILKLAVQAGLNNLSDFETCLNDGKYRERVLKDAQEGLQVGVQATPTFIIGIHDRDAATVNGEMFSGVVSEEKFIKTIEKYIALSQAAPEG